MSEPTQDTPTNDGSDDEMPQPPTPEPTEPTTPTDPDPDPVPDTPTGDTIVWEAHTWYSITYACLTVGCPNENVVGSAPMFYSNDGQAKNIRVIDSTCGKQSKILTATKLNPQPVEE
ncbi:hypothetical protein AB0454_22890 [Streptomyces sp. NPDC093509]|uniref:hypothetical protein n=1 Tax=Streptomyces sp. NPDC093509 TaxID=3154982 RepID=UPI00344D52E8